MQLTFPVFDGRRRGYWSITDQDTGQVVGNIDVNGVGFSGGGGSSEGGIEVSLFGGKYARTVNRYGWGFVKGVEAVLNHVTVIPKPRFVERTSAA
jgi:hypothetical protein